MNIFSSITKLLAPLLLAGGVAAAPATTHAPIPPAAGATAAVSVPDSMVQTVKKKKTRTTVTRRTVHKRTVARQTHSHAESSAAGSAAK